MKNILTFLLSATISLNLLGQFDYRGSEYFNHDEEVTIYLEADKESKKTGDKAQFLYRSLKVNVNTETGITEMLRTELGTGENSKVSFKFGHDYLSYTKKYVVISGKSSFYVYDIRNKKLSPELIPVRIKTITDTLDTEIRKIFVSKTGEYIYGTFAGGGSFMYSVCDITNIVQIPSSNNPLFTSGRVFVHQSCETPELSDAFYVSQDDSITIYRTLFQNKTLANYPKSKLAYTDEEAEQIIVTENLNAQRYVVMQESSKAFIAIDVFVGKLIPLPKDKTFSNAYQIIEYLILKDEEIKKNEHEQNE